MNYILIDRKFGRVKFYNELTEEEANLIEDVIDFLEDDCYIFMDISENATYERK